MHLKLRLYTRSSPNFVVVISDVNGGRDETSKNAVQSNNFSGAIVNDNCYG